MTPLLRANAVGFAGRLQPTDLTLNSGEMVALIGPNGGGKTSLLRALARVDRPTGEVWIGGEQVDAAPPARRARLLSFLPAAREIAWPISVRDLVALGLLAPDAQRIEQLLERLELSAMAHRPVDRLSTGERARVLLARALAPSPAALLLDEPLSNLDPYWSLTILDVLREAARDGAAVLMSLHDLGLADRFDRAIMVAKGKLVVDADPRLLLESPEFSAAFRVEKCAQGWKVRG